VRKFKNVRRNKIIDNKTVKRTFLGDARKIVVGVGLGLVGPVVAPSITAAQETGDENRTLIHGLVKDLKDKDQNKRWRAAAYLGQAAFRGTDISSAVPALKEALKDDMAVAWRASAALVFHYSKNGNWTEVKKLLKSKNTHAMYGASSGIADIANKGMDISQVVPDLISIVNQGRSNSKLAASALTFHYVNNRQWSEVDKLLKEESKEIKKGALDALKEAPLKGVDVKPLVPTLEGLLNDRSVRDKVVSVLTFHYALHQQYDKIDGWMNSKNMWIKKSVLNILETAASELGLKITGILPSVAKVLGDEKIVLRLNAAEVFFNVAEKGRDISAGILALEKALDDENGYVKSLSAGALSYHYLYTGNYEGFRKLLFHKDDMVRETAIRTSERYGEKMGQ